MCQVCETRTTEQREYVQGLMDQVQRAVNEDGTLDPSVKTQIQAAYGFKWMTEREWAWVDMGLAILELPTEEEEEWVEEAI